MGETSIEVFAGSIREYIKFDVSGKLRDSVIYEIF